ncbi:response regulator [Nitriliruptoraceae bacterium ZYF776]|nr:response regulator [Profundirhabdus halotolerans]
MARAGWPWVTGSSRNVAPRSLSARSSPCGGVGRATGRRAARLAVPSTPRARRQVQPVPSAQRSVLVVDDEPDVRLLCRVNLEFEGYEVREAADGEAALAALAASRPDAVLLDVMLPVIDGWQILDHIKSDPHLREVPVVMLTARSFDDDQIRGWRSGAAEYIVKPFSPLALSGVLDDVLTTDPVEEERRRRLVLEKLQLLHGT